MCIFLNAIFIVCSKKPEQSTRVDQWNVIKVYILKNMIPISVRPEQNSLICNGEILLFTYGAYNSMNLLSPSIYIHTVFKENYIRFTVITRVKSTSKLCKPTPMYKLK